MTLPARVLSSMLALCAFAAHAQSPDVLSTLRPAHPRLILLDSDLPAVHATIAADPFAAAIYAELVAEGNAMLNKPVHVYELNGSEHNLLSTARDIEHIVCTLAGLYRLTGDRKYADRAIVEMLNTTTFPDWYPPHFLDTAEITAAMAIGYDWLYPILTPEQRTQLRAAIVAKGLDPWLAITRPAGPDNPKGPIFHATNNWVQVCVGGETLGALALAEDEPVRARTIVANSQNQMRQIMKLFAPDGGFEEGPTYWSYATNYNVLYLAALDSALGTDFDISKMPGFAETGAYRIQSLGPFFDSANFGDAHESNFRSPQMYWMANRFHKPEYTLAERRIDEGFWALPEKKRNNGESGRFLIFMLAYYHPPATAAEPATVQSFERIGQAYIRSNWSRPDGKVDPDAWYIALKGGSAKASHGHLDLGSFIVDAFGERWSIDLGGESYGVPHYFDMHKERWTYFRTRTESHNTLMIDGENEDLDANTPLTAVGQTGVRKFAILDLSSANKTHLKHWGRGVELLGNNRMLVQDEIVPSNQSDIVWSFFTRAQLQPDASPQVPNDSITLRSHGKKLRLRILSPAGAQFTTRPIPTLTPPQVPISGVTDVVISLPNLSTAETITVLITSGDDTSPTPQLVPLAQWNAAPK